MRILCRVENEETQGWSMALSKGDHQFSFYDGTKSIHHVSHLFRPEMYICNNKYLNRSMQNACAKHKTVIINIDKHRKNIPLLANTYLYNRYPVIQTQNDVLVFGSPTTEHVGLVNSISQKYKVKIFNQERWPLNEYCGFLHQSEFLNLVNTSVASLVVSDTLDVKHFNVIAAGGTLLHNIDAHVGHKISSIDDMKVIDDPLTRYNTIRSFNDTIQERSVTRVTDILMGIYEEENFFFDR